MNLFNQRGTILITCPKGIVPFLAGEVQALGCDVGAQHEAAVELQGSLADTMKLNLHLRTAHRVLFEVAAFRARSADHLYQHCGAVAWEDLLPEEGYFSVDSAVATESIRDTRFANVRCKDAIVDRIRARRGRRPDSGHDVRGAAVFVYWRGDDCHIYLNTSGEPLSRRGYRKISHKAPMQETLAAAIVLATGWNGTGHFVNPMCGSGTLAIEAAMIALRRAPGLLRTAFAFQHLLGFEEAAWEQLRREARLAARKQLQGRILATDLDPRAVEAARNNAMTAGVDTRIEFGVCDFAETEIPAGEGVVVLNPEYGERLGTLSELEQLYPRIGDFLKQRCTEYRGFVLTGNASLAKRVGLRTRRRTVLFNSNIECRLLEYEMYAGTRRAPKAPPPPGPGGDARC